jgi:hypothetical protein
VNKSTSPSPEGVLDEAMISALWSRKTGKSSERLVGSDRFTGELAERQLTELSAGVRI